MKTKRWMTMAAAAILSAGATLLGADSHFRTDINPALLYFQAYQNMPQLNEADAKHLFDFSGGAWPDKPLDEKARALLQQYDSSFKLIRRARFSKVPCDWGYDLSDGPEALLPGLAPAKRISQVTRLRAMVALDQKNFKPFLEDMAAATALARQLSTDRILISALVQFAMENILTSIVMENYYRLSADELDHLVKVFDSGPRRGTVADTIPTENDAFFGYTLRKVETLLKETEGNAGEFWKKFAVFWNPLATEPDSKTGPSPSAEQIKEAARGEPAGVVKLLLEMPARYQETARLMALPYPEFKRQSPAFMAEITSSPNPFIGQFFTVFKNLRGKEFSVIVRHEMIRAAAAYKRGGSAALASVQDPLAGGPFEFSRAQFEGVDRGFQLKSKEPFRDFPEVMIFLEKPGKHFRLDGKNAGTAK